MDWERFDGETISIPSGAIKSSQILRLAILVLSISIPSGAIKSIGAAMGEVANWVFQFLLVRLRAPTIFARQHFFITFQFLLVRLRGRREGYFRQRCNISIPSGAIKSYY